jgi:methyl-accepting chemotaxis protein
MLFGRSTLDESRTAGGKLSADKQRILQLETKLASLEKKFTELENENSVIHNNAMTLVMGITDYFEVIKALGDNDLSVKANENTGEDLLNSLGAVTNKMIASLRDVISKMKHQITNSTASSANLAKIAEQSSNAVSQLSNTIMQISSASAWPRRPRRASTNQAEPASSS